MVLCNPMSCWYRYLLLLLICYMEIAIFYCVEILSGLQKTIITVFKITSLEYNILFSSYTWSIMILCIIGSILIDRVIGRRTGMIVSAFCSFSGVIVFVVAVILKSYIFQVFGRVIMGFGMGCLDSVQSTFVSLWFKDKITFAMGFVSASNSLGAAIGLVVPELLYNQMPHSFGSEYFKLGLTFSTGLILFFTLFLCSITFVILHTRGLRFFVISPSAVHTNRVNLLSSISFPLIFWLTSISTGIFYSIFDVSVANTQMFLISKFDFTAQQANSVTFLVFASPVLFNPLIGYIVQNTGYNICWGIFGTITGAVSLILNIFITEQQYYMPYVTSILFALSFSLFGVAIDPIPSMIVPEYQLATAYSLVSLLQSFGLLSLSIISGFIIDQLGYMWFMIFFTFIGCTVLMTLVLVAVIDKKVNSAGQWIVRLKIKSSKSISNTE